MNKVILIGYMAVGKSTIAKLLSEKTRVRLIDLDKLIEVKTKRSVSEIFEQKGEIYFRKIEHEIFKEYISSSENLIISTGGGTPCYANNHLLLNGENITSIYLKASIDLIFERLKFGKGERPLISGLSDEELKEFIAKHLFDRSFYYNCATNKIEVDNKSPELIVDEILQLLN